MIIVGTFLIVLTTNLVLGGLFRSPFWQPLNMLLLGYLMFVWCSEVLPFSIGILTLVVIPLSIAAIVTGEYLLGWYNWTYREHRPFSKDPSTMRHIYMMTGIWRMFFHGVGVTLGVLATIITQLLLIQ